MSGMGRGLRILTVGLIAVLASGSAGADTARWAGPEIVSQDRVPAAREAFPNGFFGLFRKKEPNRARRAAPRSLAVRVSPVPVPRPDPDLTRIEELRARLNPAETAPDAEAIAGSPAIERLAAYRDAVLLAAAAETRHAEVVAELAALENRRSPMEILREIEELPDWTPDDAPRMLALTGELEQAGTLEEDRAALEDELAALTDILYSSKTGLADARAALLPEGSPTPETLALVHDLLDLPPSD